MTARRQSPLSSLASDENARLRLSRRCSLEVSRIRRGRHRRPTRREWPVVRAPRVCPGGVSARPRRRVIVPGHQDGLWS